MAHVADAYRDFLAACNLRDWSAVAALICPTVHVNGVQEAGQSYVSRSRSTIQASPDLHWVSSNVVIEGERLGVTLFTRCMGRSGVQIVIYQWSGDRIAAMWSVGGTAG